MGLCYQNKIIKDKLYQEMIINPVKFMALVCID